MHIPDVLYLDNLCDQDTVPGFAPSKHFPALPDSFSVAFHLPSRGVVALSLQGRVVGMVWLPPAETRIFLFVYAYLPMKHIPEDQLFAVCDGADPVLYMSHQRASNLLHHQQGTVPPVLYPLTSQQKKKLSRAVSMFNKTLEQVGVSLVYVAGQGYFLTAHAPFFTQHHTHFPSKIVPFRQACGARSF